MRDEKRFLTEIEVEQVFGLGKRFLRAARMRNDGPPFKKFSGRLGERGGRVLYPMSGVQAWLEAQPGGGDTLGAA